MPNDKLFLTALPTGTILTLLPNGTKRKDFRLSLLLTPSLADNQNLQHPFDSWPEMARDLNWTVGFYTTGHAAIGGPIPASPDPDSLPDFDPPLWGQVFAGVTVKRRQTHQHLNKTWRLSHNISKLHQHHSLLRMAHAYKQVAEANSIEVSSDVNPMLDGTLPPRIFLHPKFASNVARQYDERADALTSLTGLVNALPDPYKDPVSRRVKHGTEQLEHQGGAPLSAVALSALYRACFETAGPAGHAVPAAAAAIATINSWFPPKPPRFPATPGDLDTIQPYVQLLLFHRRNRVKPNCKIDRPDFHQLLGLVHNYPAMMRPLGLVYDLNVTPPPGLPASFSINVNLANDAAGNQLKTLVDVSSVYTQCTVSGDDFFATPSNPDLIHSGLLNLKAAGKSASKRFSLVSEAADGQAIKLTDQANNSERADEFQSSAPTSMRQAPALPADSGMSSTPAAPSPTAALPAPRTVGLALFDQDRLIQVEDSAARYPDAADGSTPLPPTDFYAEDLILGYRVDVLYKSKFYSLCERQSTYDIFAPRSTNQLGTWTPKSRTEINADEGFISFGASQSVIDPKGQQDPTNPAYSDNSITQIHQSVFTWTGWSLAVPPLKGFPTMNPQDPANPATPDCSAVNSQHLAIQPRYQLKDGFKLPPLRFNTDYTVRCRIVDLAGNSALPTLDPSNTQYARNTIQPDAPFSLHEPIRAPHFLLLKPIDRGKEPGTHVDRIVVREDGEESARMLVPPRESLRLAELWGLLESDRLPHSAFGAQQLLEDGSFPSVACLKEKGWLHGAIQSPGDNDAIFMKRQFGDEPKNPYYPDPLANFVRVEVFQLSDDPTQSRLLSTHYIDIKKNHSWPQCLPARIRVTATADGDPSASVDPDGLVLEPLGLFSVPTLEIKIPEACVLVLKIRSAASKRGGAETDSRYDVHLTHLARLPFTNPQALSVLTGDADGATIHNHATGAANALQTQLTSSNPFVDGSVEISTPSRTMTVVHPVRRPKDPPKFAPEGSAGDLTVFRDAGRPEAHVTGQLRAHWPSTAKITCYAEWSDCVDDLNKAEPGKVHHREVAFVVTARELASDTPWPASRLRTLKAGLLQHFLDTRAHEVTYSLVASTNFREYFPGTDPAGGDRRYQRDGLGSVKLTVASSVRPLAPKLSYLIPAFFWTNSYDRVKKTWYTGRTVILRAYFERPFLLSGDHETVGVVLYDPSSGVDPGKQNYVSRWGADPVRPITKPILQNELSEVNLCEAGHPPVNCTLAEGDQVRIKPCAVHYSTERQLWYADVPINTQNCNTSFVRLAFVRWQPDSLTGASEARCSEAVFAEFMQVSPDRWVSVQKRSGSKYNISISGAFANDPSHNPFMFTLQQRWYALGRDMGWRNVEARTSFVYTPADATGVSTWSADLETRHSAYAVKYRLLIQERDLPDNDRRKSFSTFVDLP